MNSRFLIDDTLSRAGTQQMNYKESLDYIKSLVPTLERPTMDRMKQYFSELGNPQNQLQVLHVGGTNGKGSVSTFLATMLQQCGKRVGKFTGPHLLKYNERLVLDGCDISDAEFAAVASVVLQQSQDFAVRHPELGLLTWFEFLTAMAVHYFLSKEVDVAVFEVGLGGRFDATNALENIIVSTITNVDLDHMQFLGDTVEKIAAEKSGIIKGAPLVTAASGGALPVILAKAASVASPAVSLARFNDLADFSVTVHNATPQFAEMVEERLHILRTKILLPPLSLSAAYQRANALTALISFCLTDIFAQLLEENPERLFASLRLGIESAYWPGRFEILEDKLQILDGAHNPHGARALRLSLDELYPGRQFVFIFASFENKDAASFLSELIRPGDLLIAPALSAERALHSFADIEPICNRLGVSARPAANFSEAAGQAREYIEHSIAAGHLVAPMAVVTGSFATVRGAKAL